MFFSEGVDADFEEVGGKALVENAEEVEKTREGEVGRLGIITVNEGLKPVLLEHVFDPGNCIAAV